MKLKGIVEIVLIVLWVITVLIFLLDGKINILEGASIITAGVLIIRVVSYFIGWIFGKNLEEINDQLNNVYFPMRDAIEDFQKERGFTAYSSEAINNTSDLEITFNKIIDRNTDIEIDSMIMKFKVMFFSTTSNTNGNLNTFLRAINHKIKKLKDEKRKYM